jgi:hypothetical protein
VPNIVVLKLTKTLQVKDAIKTELIEGAIAQMMCVSSATAPVTGHVTVISGLIVTVRMVV